MIKLFCILLVVILFPLINYGQKGFLPGYIITNDCDTNSGFIDIKSNLEYSRSCVFKELNEHNITTFHPEDIRAYRIENSKYYRSMDVTIDSIEQKVFLEYLVDGIVDLYYLKEQEKELFFVEKDAQLVPLSNDVSQIKVEVQGEIGITEKTYLKNSDQYKRMLTYLFQESPDILKRIPNTSFAYKPLINITKDYHNSVCDDYSCLDFTKSTEQVLFVEPTIGIINALMGIRIKTSETYEYDLKPFIGFNLIIKPFKGFSKFDLITGVSYSNNSFDGIYDGLYNDFFPIQYHVVCDYSLVRIPLGVDYTFNRNKFRPYVSFTVNNIIILNPVYEVTRVDNNNIVETPFRKFQAGLSPGIGVKYIFKNNSYFFVKNDLEVRVPASGFGYILDNQIVFSDLVSVGYGIKIK